MTSDPGSSQQPTLRRSRPQARLIACFAIFLLACGVRALTWHDRRLEVGKVQTAVVADYQRVAELFRAGGTRSFFSSSSALADLNTLGHPPGYPILIAGIYSIAGRSITAVQMFQIAADALAAVILFLIVAELLPLSAGVVAGLLAAFSPQLAWNSVLLLPDSISVLPILLAIYLLTRVAKNPRWLTFMLIGALIGVSCWLRANAMLLTVLLAAAALLMFTRKRWQFAMAVICGTLLIVLPLTIRNAIVFHRFIPLSLGAGQTFLEGIADYDKETRFGVPSTDMGIMKQEAEIYQRPDYYGTLFNPDGVERERARLSRGFAIVRSHPFWFAGVMAKRASSMVRLERARLISTEPSNTHELGPTSEPISVYYAPELLRDRISGSSRANMQIDFENEALAIEGDDSRYGPQGVWPLATQPDTDYVLQSAAKVESGRMRISVIRHNQVVSSTVIDMLEATKPADQPFVPFQMGFVSNGDLQIVVNNEAPNTVSKVKAIKLFELGPARFVWTRYPRFVIHAIQKLFLTALMLPLAIVGLLILIVRKQSRALVILWIVPLYFFLVQSIVHTEYRYVLAVYYFLFGLVGVCISSALDVARRAKARVFLKKISRYLAE